jgi:GNAT superfamily N-acetyltransferase
VQQAGLEVLHPRGATHKVRFTVEPSPAGGFVVRLEGVSAPLSRHDTEDEAQAHLRAYERGAATPPPGEIVDLPDGSEVVVRPVRPEDKPLFVAGWERLGEESRYRRFMGHKTRLTVRELDFFTDLDHVDHEAIGATALRTGEGLGVARYMRREGRPDTAEAAVAVIDAWQGRGLGGVLLRRLCRRAQANGIRTFTATLLTGNRSMLHLFERLGSVVVRDINAGIMEIDVELPVAETGTLLRTAATGHVGLGSRP